MKQARVDIRKIKAGSFNIVLSDGNGNAVPLCSIGNTAQAESARVSVGRVIGLIGTLPFDSLKLNPGLKRFCNGKLVQDEDYIDPGKVLEEYREAKRTNRPDAKAGNIEKDIARVRLFLKLCSLEHIGHLTCAHLENYKKLRLKKIKPATVKRELNPIKAFANWCYKRGYLFQKITDFMEPLRIERKRTILYLTKDEIWKVIKTANEPVYCKGPAAPEGAKIDRILFFMAGEAKTLKQIYGALPGYSKHSISGVLTSNLEKRIERVSRGVYAPLPESRVRRKTIKNSMALHEMVAIAVYAGLRLSEILYLWRRDINLESNILSVTHKKGFSPKTNQERRIPLNRNLRIILKKFCKENLREPDELLFQTSTGKKIHRGSARNSLKRLFRRAKLDLKKANWNVLRHTFATQLVSRKVSIYKVSKWLGHGSIKTTEKYYAAFAQDFFDSDIDKI